MSHYKSFLLIPNHSMSIDSDLVIIESAEADMLEKLGERFSTLGVAAFETRASITSLSGELDRSKLKLHTLSSFEHDSAWRKVINYFRTALILPFILMQYDVVYIFCPGYIGLFASLWSRLLRKPYGIYIRGTWLNKNGKTAFWWRSAFKGAKFMIVTGESFKRRLQVYCKNVVNEVPLTALTPCEVDLSDLSERSYSRIIFVGRLNESKGVRDAIRAVAQLGREGVKVELLIAGGGTDDEIVILNKLRVELEVEGNVRLLGHITPNELGKAYKRSSIFVFPSYYAEGFPRVLYEAMMYSTAIITCEMPGTEGFLIDGENCVYTPPADSQCLADNLRRLLNDKSFTLKIAGNARQDVERVYESFVDQSHAHQILRFMDTV